MYKQQFISIPKSRNSISPTELELIVESPTEGVELELLAGSALRFAASARMFTKVTRMEVVSAGGGILASAPGDRINVMIPFLEQGTHRYSFFAHDEQGAMLFTSPRAIYVHGGPKETFEAKLLKPEKNHSYNVLKGIPFDLSVKLPEDPNKRVVRVEVQLNALRFNMTTAPYVGQIPTPDFGIGTHDVSAKVFLEDGSEVQLETVTVNLVEGRFQTELKVIPQAPGFVRWSGVTYEGSAYSDAGVERLELVNQDGYVLASTEGPGPLRFQDVLWSVGPHTVRLRATDSMYNQRESQEFYFYVLPRPGDRMEIKLNSPRNGWEYNSSNIRFFPEVSVPDTWTPKAIRVEYWEGDQKIAEALDGPYAVERYLSRGEHVVKAKVVIPDPEGEVEFESTEVRFVVK